MSTLLSTAEEGTEPVCFSPAQGPIVRVTDLVCRFDTRTVLDGISFEVRGGETLVVMGASGCGKSTLLRLLTGAMRPTSGTIEIFGQDIADLDGPALDALRLRFGVLFQSGALLQSLTVGENVALPVREHGGLPAGVNLEDFVRERLEMVGLSGFEDYEPAAISGGMKKRVGLARALALKPELLFSDEPTSGLDPIMTGVIDRLTLDLKCRLGMTAVIVTHDLESAFRIADRMLMLGSGRANQGRIVAEGTPEEMRANPDPQLQQFLHGQPDGHIPLHLSHQDRSNDHLVTRPVR